MGEKTVFLSIEKNYSCSIHAEQANNEQHAKNQAENSLSNPLLLDK